MLFLAHPRRLLTALLTLWISLLLASVAEATGKPFDASAFEAAKKAGSPILLAVHADWCATCRAQEPVVDELLREPKFSKYVVFRVDFDKQKDVVRKLGVQWQSTLIVYKGAREVARSTAAVERAAIAAQLAKAL
jgi:thioredoxin-like negative regulator of GroEL